MLRFSNLAGSTFFRNGPFGEYVEGLSPFKAKLRYGTWLLAGNPRSRRLSADPVRPVWCDSTSRVSGQRRGSVTAVGAGLGQFRSPRDQGRMERQPVSFRDLAGGDSQWAGLVRRRA